MKLLDWIPTLECCCCCSVCQGSLIIGFLQILYNLYLIIMECLHLSGVYPGKMKFNYLFIPISAADTKNEPLHMAEPISNLLRAVILCISGLLLIFGIYQNIPKLILYWICVALVVEIFNIADFFYITIISLLGEAAVNWALPTIIVIAIEAIILFYCICIVTSCYKEIVGEEDEYYY